MKKIFSALVFLLLWTGFGCTAFGAPEKVPQGLDILTEAPAWIAEDREAAQVLRFDVPKIVPSHYPYASDMKDILETARDHRNRYKLYQKRTRLPIALLPTDLMRISQNLKGEYLLYLLFEPQSPTNNGPWDSLKNPLTLKVILIHGANKEVLFENTYPCTELADETIDLGTRMGVHFTRPGDPTLRLSPPEVVKAGLRKATPEVLHFLNELPSIKAN